MRRLIQQEMKLLLLSDSKAHIEAVHDLARDLPLYLSVQGKSGNAHAYPENIDMLLYDLDDAESLGTEGLKSVVQRCDLPVVALSVRHDEDHGIQSILAGAQDFAKIYEIRPNDLALKCHFSVVRYRMQAQIIAAKQEAEHQLKMKSKFMAHLSHEIRGTLSAIVGVSQLLDRSDVRQVYNEELDVLAYGSQKLLSTVNDILDVSKMESGLMSIVVAPVSVQTIFEEVTRVFLFEARKRGLELSYDIAETLPAVVYTDGNRVRQVLFNLVNNAIKYTHRGSITLRAEATHDDSMILLSVCDTGRGLQPDFIDVMFDDYKQEQQKDNQTGTGLGLGICRDFTRLLGGEIGAVNNRDYGCTVWFTIRDHVADYVQKQTFSSQETNKLETSEQQQLSLPFAIVDDDFLCQRVLSMQLKSLGFDAAVFSSGAEVVRELSQAADHYQGVFLDCTLGDMTGLDIVHQLRQHAVQVPVIGVSGDVSEVNVEACLEGGMQAFLPKPVCKEDVKKAIRRVQKRSEK